MDTIKSLEACKWLQHGRDYDYSNMLYAETSANVVENECFKKFTRKVGGPGIKLMKEMVQIWLNKVEILADHAEKYHDKLVVWIDAALDSKEHQ